MAPGSARTRARQSACRRGVQGRAAEVVRGRLRQIYKQLFASLEPQRKAYIPAMQECRVRRGARDHAGGVRSPARRSKSSRRRRSRRMLRDFDGRTCRPKLAGRANFYFAKINELETHPPRRAGARHARGRQATARRIRRSSSAARPQTQGDVVPRRFLEVLSPDRQAGAFQGRQRSARTRAEHRHRRRIRSPRASS